MKESSMIVVENRNLEGYMGRDMTVQVLDSDKDCAFHTEVVQASD